MGLASAAPRAVFVLAAAVVANSISVLSMSMVCVRRCLLEAQRACVSGWMAVLSIAQPLVTLLTCVLVTAEARVFSVVEEVLRQWMSCSDCQCSKLLSSTSATKQEQYDGGNSNVAGVAFRLGKANVCVVDRLVCQRSMDCAAVQFLTRQHREERWKLASRRAQRLASCGKAVVLRR